MKSFQISEIRYQILHFVVQSTPLDLSKYAPCFGEIDERWCFLANGFKCVNFLLQPSVIIVVM